MPAPSSAAITGEDLPTAKRMAPALGLAERPLGAARWNYVNSGDLYGAILDAEHTRSARRSVQPTCSCPMATADTDAKRSPPWDFYAHADLFMTPIPAELADVVLPIGLAPSSARALRIGFEIGRGGASRLIRFRRGKGRAASRKARRIRISSSTSPARLGLGAEFWDGDVEAAYRFQLEPKQALPLEQLRSAPGGLRVPLKDAPRQIRRARMQKGNRAVSLRLLARSSSIRKRSSNTATRRCRTSRSHRSARWRDQTSRRAFRWS